MSNSKITVKDLARICGVSIGTIDRAINNRGGINPDTKKKILDAANEYGFVKNQNALNLSSGQSNLIGVIIFNLANEFFTTLLTAIESEAGKRGYSTLIMLSNYSPDAERSCVERMRSMNVAGIIVMSVITDPDYYASLSRSGLPVVAVGNRVENIPFVGIDDFEAMKAGTAYVLSRGCKRLKYIAPLLEKAPGQNISAQSERLNGFLAAAKAAGAEYELIDSYGEYERRMVSLKDELLRDFEAGRGRTVLICPSDTYTIRCLPLLGESCGILGFDRLPLLGTLLPKLSSVTYPTDEIGRSAVSVLLDGGGDRILPFEIIRGETV